MNWCQLSMLISCLSPNCSVYDGKLQEKMWQHEKENTSNALGARTAWWYVVHVGPRWRILCIPTCNLVERCHRFLLKWYREKHLHLHREYKREQGRRGRRIHNLRRQTLQSDKLGKKMSDSEGEGPQREKQLKIVILGDGASGKVCTQGAIRVLLVPYWRFCFSLSTIYVNASWGQRNDQ